VTTGFFVSLGKKTVSKPVALDTNILARYLLDDIPDHTVRVKRLFHSAAQGDVQLSAPASVFVELAHLLHRRRSIPRPRVAAALAGILRLQGLEISDRTAIADALEFWESTGGLSFVDCYHLALTKELGMTQIYTFDKKMDRYPGVERIEP
jgi:predicted nucleic acid-binding protein